MTPDKDPPTKDFATKPSALIGNTSAELTPSARKALRAEAHHLDPVVAVGDAGLSESVLAEIDRALTAHGLIKIRVHGDDRERRLEMLDEICSRLRCAPVQAIGKLLVVWRRKPETGTGGDAGTARRRSPRQTKKAAGAGQTASGGRPKAAGSKRPGASGSSTTPAQAARGPGAGMTRGARGAVSGSASTTRGAASGSASTARAPKPGPTKPVRGAAASPLKPARAAAGRAGAGFAKAGSAARPATRSARPVSGTRGRRRAP